MKKWLSARYEGGADIKPMKKHLTASWDQTVSTADLEKLRAGFRARDMDDKWQFLIEDPDKNGNVSVHIIRSWLAEECYAFTIVSSGGENMIKTIAWEGDLNGKQCDAEQAQKEIVLLSRTILNCEFADLPAYPSSVLWDSKAYRTAQ